MTSVKCTDDPNKVYRYADGQLRWYPNPSVASSWDPNWTKITTLNCTNIPKGPTMEMKPAVAPTMLTEPTSRDSRSVPAQLIVSSATPVVIQPRRINCMRGANNDYSCGNKEANFDYSIRREHTKINLKTSSPSEGTQPVYSTPEQQDKYCQTVCSRNSGCHGFRSIWSPVQAAYSCEFYKIPM